jgi:transcriptional regulator with XRE-family HTH domain
MRYDFDAAELRRRRQAAGLTHQSLAVAIGRHASLIAAYETRGTVPSMRSLTDLCRALRCQPSDLIRPVVDDNSAA